MVDLPKTMIVPSRKHIAGKQIYSAHDRIAIKPEDVFVPTPMDAEAIYEKSTALFTQYTTHLEAAYQQIADRHREEMKHMRTLIKAAADSDRKSALASDAEYKLDGIANTELLREQEVLKAEQALSANLTSGLLQLNPFLLSSTELNNDESFGQHVNKQIVGGISLPRMSDRFNEELKDSAKRLHAVATQSLEPVQRIFPIPEIECVALFTLNDQVSGLHNFHDKSENPLEKVTTAFGEKIANKEPKNEVISALNKRENEFKNMQLLRNFVLTGEKRIVESERIYKRLFLDSLATLAAKEGVNLHIDSMLEERMDQAVTGSQSMLARHNFTEFPHPTLANIGLAAGNSESTTKYSFGFGFAAGPIDRCKLSIKSFKATVTQPVFLVDDKALSSMEAFGISQETIDDFFKGYMQMAGMAEHDYIHAITLPHLFEGDTSHRFSSSESPYGSGVEEHALSIHAEVVEELFRQQPQRKGKVLEWAARDFEKIAEIQNQMRASATTAEQEQEADTIGTYLTEIYSHRLFRVISPDDPDLKKPLPSGTSVYDHLQSINILTPDNFSSRLPDKPDNLDRVLVHCSILDEDNNLGDKRMYADIHRNRRFTMHLSGNRAQEVEMSNMQILGMCRDYVMQKKEETIEPHNSAAEAYLEVDRLRRQPPNPENKASLHRAKQELREVKSGSWVNRVLSEENEAASTVVTTVF